MPLARHGAIASVLGALVAVLGCAPGRFVPPRVAPTPMVEGADAWAEATRDCAAMDHYRGELRLGGRLFGPAVTLAVALDAEGHVAIDARVNGTSVFTLRGTEAAATLVIPDRRQFVSAPPDAILEALVGVSVGPTRLLSVLTGCVSVTRELQHAERVGRVARVTTRDAAVYLERTGGRWRARAGVFGGVSVDYGELGADAPRRLTVRAMSATGEVELAIRVAAFDTARVPAAQFVAVVPSSATPLSLEELRADGPFRRRPN